MFGLRHRDWSLTVHLIELLANQLHLFVFEGYAVPNGHLLPVGFSVLYLLLKPLVFGPSFHEGVRFSYPELVLFSLYLLLIQIGHRFKGGVLSHALCVVFPEVPSMLLRPLYHDSLLPLHVGLVLVELNLLGPLLHFLYYLEFPPLTRQFVSFDVLQLHSTQVVSPWSEDGLIFLLLHLLKWA